MARQARGLPGRIAGEGGNNGKPITLYGEAEEDCNKALMLDKCCVKALFRRAIARRTLNRPKEALSDYKQALKVDGKNEELAKIIQELEKDIWNKEEEKALISQVKRRKQGGPGDGESPSLSEYTKQGECIDSVEDLVLKLKADEGMSTEGFQKIAQDLKSILVNGNSGPFCFIGPPLQDLLSSGVWENMLVLYDDAVGDN
ncbi:hypothetical protein CBR_g3545 [Chara braunii]|uniref:Uncharacterized protein n=1 Tax=Chara braunii TaxID=69332 RepID=A0A388KFN7_CHABU|nr:hypothetical protein CBR_g3545 [Chara braunii]|eukprot:GBG68851.1 hypothetical protein CBR_g3545 [Chara braunii]